jgi:Zn-dependent peptidase ImmA (M78 family)/plasmid maintenance system antidote protein VapI
MERLKSINPERIAWCCDDYDITPDDLASVLHISASSIDRLMKGDDGITFIQLRKIAVYFGRGVMFFLEAGRVNEKQVHTPQFRTLANQKPELSSNLKKLIERAEKQREVYLSLLEDMDETERLQFSPPDLPSEDIPGAAHIVRNWLKLDNENTFNSYRSAVEAQGILVFRSNGYSGKWQIPKQNPILGFTLYDQTCPIIFIKKQLWETRQSFTLMHELGHLLLHKTSSIDDAKDFSSHHGLERDANAFAGHLLVPDSFLASINDKERPSEVSQYDVWLRYQRNAWGVSVEMILRRLLDSGRLPQELYAEYRDWRSDLPIQSKEGGDRSYRHREPKHVFGDTFVRTVLDALNAQRITLAKASSYLDGLKIKDLHQLGDFYARL